MKPTDIILQKLREIEVKYDVTVLYACETGSRAWGFPSPDSDYDVRFVYAFKDYMVINEPRDVIEYQVDETWDITGWELRKALRLFRNTNSAMIERLHSPIKYMEVNDFLSKIRTLTPQYYAPKAGMHHYLSMTRNLFEQDFQGETVRLKKLFYVVRTSLAALWIAKNQTAPPMTLGELRVNLPPHLDNVIDDLLVKKAISTEKFDVENNKEICDFVRNNIDFCQNIAPQLPENKQDVALLNHFFKTII
jgi:uncharacterized protein